MTTAPTDCLEHLQRLLAQFKKDDVELPDNAILTQLDTLIQAMSARDDNAYALGQDWLCGLFTFHPQLSPAIDRSLLWFFGGECLHFLTDDEISAFQQQE